MRLKKICVWLTALAITAAAAGYTAFAQEDYTADSSAAGEYTDTQTAAVTTAATEYSIVTEQSAGNEVTTTQQTTTTTTYATDKPTSKPAAVTLDVSEVKDGKFTVKLLIESDSLISNASISISYDNTLIEYVSASNNDEAGGMAVENNFDGKYVYNYVNKDGSDYSGAYSTLTFKVLDEEMVSTVLYLSVTSLDDDSLVPISYSSENGIVKNGEAAVTTVTDETELPIIDIAYSELPVLLSDYGIDSVKDCVVENGEILLYENGAVLTLETGATRVDITFEDDSVKSYLINVTQADEAAQAYAEISDSGEDDSAVQKTEGTVTEADNSLRNLLILIVALIALLLIIIEYVVIMKPFGRRAKKSKEQQEEFDEEDEDNSQMLAELEKAIAAKNEQARQKREENSETAQLNKELIARGFILADDADYDEDENND